MSDRSPDYSAIASTYDSRYRSNPLTGVGEALASLVQQHACRRVLEVGCGTGHWLAQLHPHCDTIIGLDLSVDMLRMAREKDPSRLLIRGRGESLPLVDEAFDLVFCVNALCHFAKQREFVSEAQRVLTPGGVVAVIGSDPRGRAARSWVYQYFAGAYETDLVRFPAWEDIAAWMEADGFIEVICQPVERVSDPKVGREMLSDPFLRKHSCSQLALLSDEAYAAGIRKIEAAIVEAEARGEAAEFPFELTLAMVRGKKSQGRVVVGPYSAGPFHTLPPKVQT